MIDEKFDWTVSHRYYAEDISAEDRARLDTWLAADPARTAVVQAFRAERDRYTTSTPMWDVERMWGKISDQMVDLDTPSEINSRDGRHVSHPKWLRLAGGQKGGWRFPGQRFGWHTLAGAMVGMVLMLAGWKLVSARLTGSTKGSVLTYTTGNGQRANITLPDGSTVALNVASQLDVPTDYARGNHTLRLRGEALFTVPRHGGTPFVVVSGAMTARVLGTSFAVRNYATDSVALVAVRDGKVAVRSTVVAAAQTLKLNRAGVTQVGPGNSAQFSFATGVLSLNGVPFSEAIPDLDRWYDADIRLGDPTLATRRITIDCTSESLSDLAEVLEWTFNLHVVRSGQVSTLFPR